MRPRKAPDKVRIHRMMIYFSEEEKNYIDFIGNKLDSSKNDFIIQAIIEKIERLTEVPEFLPISKQNKISNSQEELLKGFICSRGHIFWVDWSWPSPPENCPNCGSHNLEQTWPGRIKRGYK